MELICVRHGRTAWNRAGRFQGTSDTPLDRQGWSQARALGVRLGKERFDLAISSNLRRALETAKVIGAATGVAIWEEPRLREMCFGAWEGLTWSQIVARNRHMATPLLPTALPVAPDGESFADLCSRVEPVITSVAGKLSPKGRALIVSHAAVMHAILRLTLDGCSQDALSIVFKPADVVRLRSDNPCGDREGTGARAGRWTLEAVDGGPGR